jgi:hypothetical protein
MPDAEIEAMSKMADALTDLDEEARGRVVRWAAERFEVVILASRKRGQFDEVDDVDDLDEDFGDEDRRNSGGDGGTQEFEHFAELYDVADPKTDAERVLVASYWTQVIHGKTTFGSQELNKVLKDLGHRVGTINKAMSTNIKKKPALILQVSRSGSTQQARKKYKLTDAGKKWVAARLA